MASWHAKAQRGELFYYYDGSKISQEEICLPLQPPDISEEPLAEWTQSVGCYGFWGCCLIYWFLKLIWSCLRSSMPCLAVSKQHSTSTYKGCSIYPLLLTCLRLGHAQGWKLLDFELHRFLEIIPASIVLLVLKCRLVWLSSWCYCCLPVKFPYKLFLWWISLMVNISITSLLGGRGGLGISALIID